MGLYMWYTIFSINSQDIPMPTSHTDTDDFDDLDNYDTPEDKMDTDPDDLDLLLGDAKGLHIVKSIGTLTPSVLLHRTLDPVNVVRKLTDMEIASLELVMAGKKLNTDPKDRQSWVFKSMQVYETVCIAYERASKAQAAVHTYSQRTGRKFSTRRNHDKSLQVTRLS
jgi:hypothetical protein